jgi:cholesterol transport system auxiliary component
MKTSLVLVAALSLALTGCLNLGPKNDRPAAVYYVLNDLAPTDANTGVQPDAPAAAPAPQPAGVPQDADPLRADVPQGGVESPPILLVLDTTAGSFYDTDQLVFSRSAGTRGHYQFARWTERPGKRFAELMRSRLDRLGAYRVAAAGGYVRGDLLLDTELVEFYHDAASRPGQVKLVLRAELVDLKRRALLGRRVFEQQVPLTTYDAAGAAQASNQAISRALDDLTAWLATLR